jgi:hypothetical protein
VLHSLARLNAKVARLLVVLVSSSPLVFLAPMQIDRASAGNVKRSKEEVAADPEQENQFGYTTSKHKLHDLSGRNEVKGSSTMLMKHVTH